MFLCSDELFVVQKGKGGGSSNLHALPAAIRTCKRERRTYHEAAGPSSCADPRQSRRAANGPALRSGGILAQTPRQDPRQSLAEHPCIRRPVAVEHARFIEQQVRGIPLEGQIVIAQRSERYDDVVTR